MNLNDMIAKTLVMLGRGRDQQTIDRYRPAFTDFANEAVYKISKRFKQCRRDAVTLDASAQFDTDTLPRQCVRIERVTDADEKDVAFWQPVRGASKVKCDTDALSTVNVIYRFVPATLLNGNDVPELPLYQHRLIPLYIRAMEMCGGDPNTQGTASAYFSIFNAEVREIESESRAMPDSYNILNY